MKNHHKPLARTARHAPVTSALPRWRFSALAAALMACAGAGLYTPAACALTLGTITVQSALGEPLRAEIDLPNITAAEADSLRAGTAAADVFRIQGMEYSATVSQMRVQLQRRPDGRTVLQLSGNSPVNEPFVDLVMDARWSAGHVTRSYTMLFDPPAARRSQAVTAPVAPSITASENRQPTASARRPAPARANLANEDAGSSAMPAAPASTRRAAARVPANPAVTDNTVRVRPGDTAGRIANAHRQQGVSLDQMLVAMTRANPSAFVQGNVNRLKSGAVLQIPRQDDALSTPEGEARQMIAVQSRDFNAFRRSLANAAVAADQPGAQRSASGRVQTRTEDSSATAMAPDKLTLSKGAMQGSKTTEEMLAKRKQGNEAAARAQELARNIEELNRLNAASGAPATASAAAPPAATATAAAASPGLALANPGLALPAEPVTAPAPAAEAAQSPVQDNAVSAQTPLEPASASASSAGAAPAAIDTAAPAATPAPEPQPESSSFVQAALEQPALPLAAGALALLLAFGVYRSVQRRRSQTVPDSGFVDSQMHPDSFFGSSGGQRVNTASAHPSLNSASLTYSPSQLDAGGEVDPVAEADVYLAYGRDLQAEEILREAARHHPQRISIPVKLCEIYAKRLDSKALEAAARDVRKLTQGQGAEWAHVLELGLQLDPDNALYQQPYSVTAPAPLVAATALGTAAAESLHPMPTNEAFTPVTGQPLDLELDLNLDFDLPEDALSEGFVEDLHSDSAANSQAQAAALPETQDWDALEDLVAFNAAIDAPPPPSVGLAPSNPPPEDFISWLDTGARKDPLTAALDELDTQPAQQTGDDLHLDLDMGWQEPPAVQPPAARTDRSADAVASASEAPDTLDALALNFDLPDLNTSAAPDSASSARDAAPAPEAVDSEPLAGLDSNVMDFDFNSLSLDLDTPPSAYRDALADGAMELDADPAAAESAEDNPLTTKLALAQEFHTIGDSEGARTLIEEVIAESSGALQVRAQKLLAEID